MKNNMTKITKHLLFIALSVILFVACNNEEFDNITKTEQNIAKIYSSDIVLATEQGEEPNISTRGLDLAAGEFTNVYPYDYIYIHSADDKTTEEGHQCLRIPLQDVVFCDGCQGIHLEMEVLDESDGGGYIIKNKVGQSMRLGEDEKVYFSTIESSYWNANVEGASPVTMSNVFIQDNDVNKELLKSAQEYSKDDLIELLSQGEPDIPMMRHCTAFRVYFQFTSVENDNKGSINSTLWNMIMGNDYSIDHFYIKLYLGPNFTEEYNVYKDDVTNPEEKGFYVTNQQKYQPFEYSAFSTTSGMGQDDQINFNGYGYETDGGNYLIAPLNTHLSADDFSVYAFIKYAPDPNNLPEDFLTSDEGAKWFKLQVPAMTLAPNIVHYIILAVDFQNLSVFKTTTNGTRVSNGPEEMDVKSVVVKDVVK